MSRYSEIYFKWPLITRRFNHLSSQSRFILSFLTVQTKKALLTTGVEKFSHRLDYLQESVHFDENLILASLSNFVSTIFS